MSEAIGRIYCADSSALIDLPKTYPADNFPGVWGKIGMLADEGRLITVDLVKDECNDKELAEWFNDHSVVTILPSTELEFSLKQIMRDLVSKSMQLVDVESKESDADPLIIACAMAGNLRESGRYSSGRYVLLQHESSAWPSPKRVRIPDVCGWYGITYIRLTALIQEEGWVFP